MVDEKCRVIRDFLQSAEDTKWPLYVYCAVRTKSLVRVKLSPYKLCTTVINKHTLFHPCTLYLTGPSGRALVLTNVEDVVLTTQSVWIGGGEDIV